jgi:hypothetical protein
MYTIKIAVATNKNFYESTLPIIIPSLINGGINPNDIHIFNAGFDEYKYEFKNDIHYHFLDHNSYEYSPLIEIVDKQLESEYWFLVHDTCKFGPNFKQLLYNIPEGAIKLSLNNKPAMTMGTYKYDYLLSVKDKIMSIRNTDYSEQSMNHWKIWGVPNEDYIMWMTEPMPIIYNNDARWVVADNDNWFGTNTQRRTEYYFSLDLYKNKSNWGQSPILKRTI